MSLLNKLFGNQAVERELMEIRHEQEMMRLKHEQEMQRMRYEHEQEMMKLRRAQEFKKTTNKTKMNLATQVGDITDKQIVFIQTMQITLHKHGKSYNFTGKTKREASKWIDAHINEFRRLERMH